MNNIELIQQAQSARKQARAPHSGYRVGAAVQTGSGKVFRGCNIESDAFPTSMCAERVAIYSALAAGERSFKALAIVSNDGSTPCGACRQVIHEQCGEIPVYISEPDDHSHREYSTSELLPFPFEHRNT